MNRFIVIVLDGFGIGAMDDVPQVRPADIGANTCRSILRAFPRLKLPTLEALGLMNAAGFETEGMCCSPTARYGRCRLTHFWADTFWGHQEIMGTKPVMPIGHCFAAVEENVCDTLRSAGYVLRKVKTKNGNILVVNEALTVADNIECDPLQAINVTAAIDDMPFGEVEKVGSLVRQCATTPRVIVFGGRGVHIENILAAIETPNGLAGVNAPRSGVYVQDYHCVHLGYGVDPQVQIPVILGRKGIPVALIGKVADIISNPYGNSISVVETEQVMAQTKQAISAPGAHYICTNVQETDLCGHRENPEAYAEILRKADKGLGEILPMLDEGDILIVMADHGNDPCIGHPHHTRERVPLLVYGSKKTGFLGERSTLSDVAATASDFFGAPMPQNGSSFLDLIKE